MQRPHLGALTGVRFFAAAHVVAYHYGRRLGWPPGPMARILDHGFTGVTLFFVLSGFILVYTHGEDGRGDGPRQFWAARFARIYPIYLLALLLDLPTLLWPVAGSATVPLKPLALSLATTPVLLQGWIPRIAGIWNGPAWSLSAEALFYATFPLLALGLVRLRRRGLLLLAGLAWIASVGMMVAYRLIQPDGPVAPGVATAAAPWLTWLRYHPLARLPEFLLGMAVGRLYLLRPATDGLERRRRMADPVAILALLASVAVVASPVALPYPLAQGGLLAPLFGLAFYALALAGGRGALSRALASAPAMRLGEASYALYILHVPLHHLSERAVQLIGWHPEPRIFFGLFMLAAIVISLIVNVTLEVPARRLLRRWLGARPGRMASPPVPQAELAA